MRGGRERERERKGEIEGGQKIKDRKRERIRVG